MRGDGSDIRGEVVTKIKHRRSILRKIIDTQETDDPNVFGETLREFVFAEEYGCYTCFDLADRFIECKKEGPCADYYAFIEELFDLEDEETTIKVFTDGLVIVAWYWDGDGTLLIKEGYKVAINTDCKKAHEWEWLARGEWEPKLMATKNQAHTLTTRN